MKIVNEYIALDGYVVATDIIQAAENFRNDSYVYDTYEDAHDSWYYRSVDETKIYQVNTRISES